MCSHYQAIKDRERFFRRFGVYPPDDSGKYDVWPGYSGLMLRRPRNHGDGDEAVPALEALSGVFGLIPHWARDAKLARHTYNARSETVHEKPSFRDAWRQAQHCIIAADAIFEPDWRSGRAVPTRISRADGESMGIAGLWARWKSPAGVWVDSYTMLTIAAQDHPLMRCFHKPEDEKRMVVILPQAACGDWLDAPVQRSRDFLQPFPADALVASA
jgi:putative SOS response-associated peptidase YedK